MKLPDGCIEPTVVLLAVTPLPVKPFVGLGTL